MGCMWAAHEAPRMEAVEQQMIADGIAPNKRTVELVMHRFETTSDWQRATEYFVAMKQAGVPPSNSGYGSLIKAYNRAARGAA